MHVSDPQLVGDDLTRRPAPVTPGPAGLVGFDAGGDPLAFLGDLIGRYGDVVRYQTRFGPCLLFVHPEHLGTILHRETYRRASLVRMMLGDGLLASDGPRWRADRRLVQPEFRPADVGRFVPAVVAATARTAHAWDAAVGSVVDVAGAMTTLTLRAIVSALFSDDLSDGAAAELSAAVTRTVTDLGQISWTIFGVPVRLTPGRNASFAGGRRVIDDACHGLIARRRDRPPADRPRDLLTLLIEARVDGKPLDDVQLRDQMVTMLVGGHETTALALAWAWQAVADHPAVEARLQAESDAVLAGRSPGAADVAGLPYARAVFQEAMRLYPPVWYMARVATVDDVVAGHPVPRGAAVLVSAWFTHRHPAFWPDPLRFDPERFLGPAAATSHRYAYMPFGGGRHQCLGMPLAMAEGTLILAQLAGRFRVCPVPGQQVRPDPGITLRQSPSLRATVERRGTGRLEAA